MKNKLAYLALGPLLFFLILIMSVGKIGDMAYVIALAVWMIFWWITEATPIPVTSLLPIIILPISGIFSITEATAPYASPIIFLFMGGFMIALGLEKHNLHLRLALNILKITGSSGNGIILGFMTATALLSMWISNTATAVMMLPIASSVVQLLSQDGMVKKERTFALSLMLGIAYSANIGGTMTLIGTPPNVVMAGYTDQLLDISLNFGNWLALAFPIGLILLSATYLLLTKILFRNNIAQIKGSETLVGDELRKLGHVSREEKWVISIFLITAIGWIFKSPINELIGAKILTDHVTAMIGGVLIFSVPSDLNGKKLVEWADTQRLPWGILLLFGGGMSLAKSMSAVGIIDSIGNIVSSFTDFHIIFLILIVTSLVLFMTEVMSNVALVTIIIPVIIGIGQGLNIDPLILVVPVTLAASCAFMMPISTPPNAIVYSSGHIKMKDMIKAGSALNILSVLILTLICYWLVPILL